ncbi:hypothetical protein CEXT_272631 [Caerostris extrusa]|uniref:Uncharacterized protein n=1 Tax=Caerostris extrusa TaxID=172846 RepID=A0AAV4SRX7_CAEEX|nr:hypothetical protein CEXT_272631 [Caerostris extrusa]
MSRVRHDLFRCDNSLEIQKISFPAEFRNGGLLVSSTANEAGSLQMALRDQRGIRVFWRACDGRKLFSNARSLRNLFLAVKSIWPPTKTNAST